MDIRELRLAIEAKLQDRRKLIAQNAALRDDVRRGRERVEFLERAMRSPLINMEMERCADEIVNAIMDQALKASSTVAEQTVDNGDYLIGIDIPSLHIRRRLYRASVDLARDLADMPIKTVTYRGSE
jgi:hypothetical protein